MIQHGHQLDNPVWDLIRSFIVWRGVSTANGLVPEIIDANLPQANLPLLLEQILILWPGAPGERVLRASDYVPAGPSILFDDPFNYYGGAGAPAGTPYVLLSIPYCSQQALLTAFGISHTSLPSWSLVTPTVTIPAVAADVDFPNVVLQGIPAAAVPTRMWAALKCRCMRDSSGAANQIAGQGSSIRIKLNAGVWGVGDIIALDFTPTQWQVAASAKEGGDVMVGENNLAALYLNGGTYNFRAEQTNRADAITATGASLVLHDVQMCLWVSW